jgi:hypothetical protein
MLGVRPCDGSYSLTGGDLCLRNSAGKTTTSQYLILFNIIPMELESKMRKLRDKFEKAPCFARCDEENWHGSKGKSSCLLSSISTPSLKL